MTLQVGGNNNHIYAMRGRDTDEGVMSIISTGYDKKEKKLDHLMLFVHCK